MFRRLQRYFLSLLLCSVLLGNLGISPALADDAVVRAVLFYSPSCPHCHKVIQETLPPLFEQYGGQLEMVGIDTSTAAGSELFGAAIQRFSISPERQAVPMLIVGETILLGSLEIPEQFPGLIEEYLAQGGVDWPDIPGFKEALQAAQGEGPAATEAPAPTEAAAAVVQPENQLTATPQPTSTPKDEPFPEPQATSAAAGLIIPTDSSPGLGARLMRDPVGNALAILVLLGMLVSLFLALSRLWPVTAVSRLVRPTFCIPILCLIGMLVAGYLAYVETTHTEAVCGPVGDCNTVQQSEYARLFGVLPIGVLGMLGYIGILGAWLLARYGSFGRAHLASLALLGMTLFGLLFSIYLTFLEPFIIGATCAWCLTSAVIMTLLMVYSLPAGRSALAYYLSGERAVRRRMGRRRSMQGE